MSPRRVTRVVLSGGPAAGKSSVLTFLGEKLEGKTFVVPEAASWWMATGAARPGVPKTDADRQHYVDWMGGLCHYQMAAEDAVINYAESYAKMTGERCTVLLDRSMLDTVAYCPTNEIEYRQIMAHALPELLKTYPTMSRETTIRHFAGRYDYVLFLPSLAVVSPTHYLKACGSNPYRREGVAEAVAINTLLHSVADRHPACVDVPADAIRAQLDRSPEESMRNLQRVTLETLKRAMRRPTYVTLARM